MVSGQNTKAETVYTVLKDFMSKVIANSKDKAMNLRLAKLGFIVYNPSEPGYLTFSSKSLDGADEEKMLDRAPPT